jgi:hypothetical protein
MSVVIAAADGTIILQVTRSVLQSENPDLIIMFLRYGSETNVVIGVGTVDVRHRVGGRATTIVLMRRRADVKHLVFVGASQ